MAGGLGISRGDLPQARITASASLASAIKLQPPRIAAKQLIGRFEAAIDRANQRIAGELKIALDNAMTDGSWQTNYGSGDIYDTGNLMESGTVTVDENGVTITYSAPYAALVHYGGYINPYGRENASVYLPARPWVSSVLFGDGPVPQFDFATYYIEEVTKEFM